MLAALHAAQGGVCVTMIRNSNNHGINIVPFLIQHFAEIDMLGGFLIPLIHSCCLPGITVRKGYDVFRITGLDVDHTSAAYTDGRKV